MSIIIKSATSSNGSSIIVESHKSGIVENPQEINPHLKINDADSVLSLFINPEKACSFCKSVNCACKPITHQKAKQAINERMQKLREVKERKRQRALQRLIEIFKEEDAALCRFN